MPNAGTWWQTLLQPVALVCQGGCQCCVGIGQSPAFNIQPFILEKSSRGGAKMSTKSACTWGDILVTSRGPWRGSVWLIMLVVYRQIRPNLPSRGATSRP
jgi:hypothetical protein